MTADRLEAARRAMRDRGVDALFVGPSADLRYLVGYHALPLERLTLLVLPREGDATLVVPELEVARAEASGADAHIGIEAWSEEEDPLLLVSRALAGEAGEPGVATASLPRRACSLASGSVRATGGEPTYAVQDRLWSRFLLELQERLPAERWVPGSRVMRELRVVKTPDELEALRAAGRAIDAVHERVPELLAPGRTEAEVGRDIADLILEDHDAVNFVIVASGPNGASPHHETASRTIAAGDAVVVDIGGTRDGYCSDMTRSYVVGGSPDGYEELHAVLLEAQEAAVAAVAPGVTAASVDAAAREVIAEAGYGEYFVHRTGHGIGIEEHEDPYIVGGNDELLREGMTFSVEPGIYVPGRYGARIEDIVAVTSDGAERLNRLSRGLVEVAA